MFSSSYDTKAGSGYRKQIQEISDRVAQEFNMGAGDYFQPINKELNCYFVTPHITNIKPFAHPIKVDINGRGTSYVCDVRGFTRLNANREVVISSALDYSVSTERCILEQRWNVDGPRRIFDLGIFQVEAFGRWISSGLRARYTLDAEAAMRISIAASFYYYCMCDDTTEDVYSDEDALKIASILGRSYGLSPQETLEVIGEPLILRSIEGLINIIKVCGNSIRLDRLSIVDIYTMYGGTWFGANGREIVAVALEHPPTFVVLIKHAMTERGFRNSMLSQILKPLEKSVATHAFLKNYDYLLHG
jgi:hypothetical protein